jgi:hypothetical protein
MYLESCGLVSKRGTTALDFFYWPIKWIFEHGPPPVQEAIWGYAKLWLPDDHILKHIDPADIR